MGTNTNKLCYVSGSAVGVAFEFPQRFANCAMTPAAPEAEVLPLPFCRHAFSGVVRCGAVRRCATCCGAVWFVSVLAFCCWQSLLLLIIFLWLSACKMLSCSQLLLPRSPIRLSIYPFTRFPIPYFPLISSSPLHPLLGFCLAFGQVFYADSSSTLWQVVLCLLCVIISFVKLDLLANTATTAWHPKLQRKKFNRKHSTVFCLPN